MRYLWASLAIFATVSAWATDPKPTPTTPDVQTQNQSQASTQSQSATQNQTVSSISGGGQGGGASNNFTERNTSIGVAMAAPIPIAPHECWFPKKGWGRGHRLAFGLWEESAVLERDDKCVQDVKDQREYELAKLEAETQLEHARAARIAAETNRSCAEQADRALAECIAK